MNHGNRKPYRIWAAWVLLFSFLTAAAVGCASHTEFGGRRVGATADWGPPPPGY